MIDLVLQSLGKMIVNTVAPHASLTLRFDQELDVVEVLKKNPEIQTQQTGLEFDDDPVSSFLMGIFNREAFKKKNLGRHRTLTLLSHNPANPSRWEESFATYGEVQVNYRLASRKLDLLEGLS